jgi:hypothetical protein
MQVREGLIFYGGRCFNVVRLFEECTQRREKISQKAAALYRNGKYLGGCTIMYEVAAELCARLKPKIF